MNVYLNKDKTWTFVVGGLETNFAETAVAAAAGVVDDVVAFRLIVEGLNKVFCVNQNELPSDLKDVGNN